MKLKITRQEMADYAKYKKANGKKTTMINWVLEQRKPKKADTSTNTGGDKTGSDEKKEPVKKLTEKQELQAQLDEKDIDYTSKTTIAQMKELLSKADEDKTKAGDK